MTQIAVPTSHGNNYVIEYQRRRPNWLHLKRKSPDGTNRHVTIHTDDITAICDALVDLLEAQEGTQ
ncbi:hypothetical protein ACNO8X_18380 [Mycobacterium sp. PDNC021]|uniref:hypothetical protein n=1 Tax=Mycobacterium sp. PDNC021 TaxID=3391399 RepID=UPI003AAF1EE6